MSKHVHVELDQDERQELEQLIHSGEAPARTQTRARILLLSDCSQGQERTDQEVAEAVLCSPSTVFSIRHRYIESGLPRAVNDKGWPGAEPKLTGEIEAKLTMLACSEPPKGQARWTLRLLANQLVELHYLDAVSHVTVREWLKKTNLSLGE
jgi:putative transposase